MNNICILNKKQSTCLPDKAIRSIASNFISDMDELNTNEIIDTLSKHNEVCSKLTNIKEKELCIIQNIKKDNNSNSKIQELINKYELSFFKPVSNKLDGNYWINNTEIDNIQHQFLITFPNYYYSFIHMFDLKMFRPHTSNLFDYSNNIKQITEIDFIDELTNNTTMNYNGDLKKYGIVCNTDLSTGGGLHWFSIFIDFTTEPIQIEYFNSSGYDIKNEHYGNRFKKFFIDLADEITLNYKSCKFIKVTNIQHQKDNTANCGAYSLYYIWERLNGKPYTYFSKNKIHDNDMEKFRSFLWRKNKKY